MPYSIDRKDLKIDTFRSSSKGGQNVNKVESAVRITHLPTGIVVTCQDERDQYRNKQKALGELVRRIKARLVQEKLADERAFRDAQHKGRVRTYDVHHRMVTDHVSGEQTTRVQDVLDGDLSLVRPDLRERGG